MVGGALLAELNEKIRDKDGWPLLPFAITSEAAPVESSSIHTQPLSVNAPDEILLPLFGDDFLKQARCATTRMIPDRSRISTTPPLEMATDRGPASRPSHTVEDA